METYNSIKKYWESTLDPVESTLSTLQSETEQEFMTIGNRLGELSGMTEEMHTRINRIMTTLAEEEEQSDQGNVINGLTAIDEYITESLQHIDQEQQQLFGHGKIFTDIIEPINQLKRTVFQLNTLGFSIKAETTRISYKSNEFSLLGEEVRKLAIDTRDNLIQVQNSQEEVTKAITSGQVDMAMLRDKEFIPLQERVKELLAKMLAFAEVVSRIQHESEALSAKFSDLASNIGAIIFDLQCHDIVRQQIEHVQEAIENCKDSVTAGSGYEESEETQLEHLTIMYATSILAAELLTNAHQTVTSALASIMEKFTDTQRQILSVGEELTALVQESLHAIDTIVAEAIREKEQVETILTNALALHQQRSQTTREMLRTAGSIREQIHAISSISEAIGLISLNGLIQAHHLRKEGVVMGTVIGEIRQLEGDTREITQALEESLAGVDAFIEEEHHGQNKGDYTRSQTIMDTTLTSLNDFFMTLQGKTESATVEGDTVREESILAAEKIAALLSSITVMQQFDDGLHQAINGMRGIINTIESGDISLDQDVVQGRLQSFREKYTMASERVVHDRVMGSEGEEEEFYDDFDDNIELF